MTKKEISEAERDERVSLLYEDGFKQGKKEMLDEYLIIHIDKQIKWKKTGTILNLQVVEQP